MRAVRTNASYGGFTGRCQLQFQACSAPSHCDFYGVAFVTGNPAIMLRATITLLYANINLSQKSIIPSRLHLQHLSNLRTTFGI
jgi:hypothetical protein